MMSLNAGACDDFDAQSLQGSPLSCVLCGEALRPHASCIYAALAFPCHLACLRSSSWDAARGRFERDDALPIGDDAGSLAEADAGALAALLATHGGGAGAEPDDAKIELCGWPGRGQDGGPTGWPGVGGTRPPSPIDALPSALFHLRGLRRLEVAHHPMTTLPSCGWRNLTGLERISFCSCSLSELPDEFAEIESLEVLAVMQNHIRRLPSGTGKLPNLRRLMITGNRIESLQSSFGPPKLRSLVAEGNEIQTVPADILQRCPDLSELRLAGNPMSRGFEDHGENGCNRPREGLSHQGSLAVAYWQGCQLPCVPDLVMQSCTESLMYLLLSDNRLCGPLPAAIASMVNLRWLYLYGNLLQELPDGLLITCGSLSTCLLEGNPLSAQALNALVRDARCREISDCRERLRLLGLDAAQVRRWAAQKSTEMQNSLTIDPAETSPSRALPACVQSGWLVAPGGRWYAKLMPSSQVCRAGGDRTLGEQDGEELPPTKPGCSVLMAAFAASQGEPEWGGALGKLHQNRQHRAALAQYAARSSLKEHVAEMQARHPQLPSGEEGLMSSLWVDFDQAPADWAREDAPQASEDFDVLLLVDPHRRWYKGEHSAAAPLDSGSFRQDFEHISARYSRVCALGASMGGFAALSCADLVDAVLAFGPQLDLKSAVYRPGFEADALDEASCALRHAVAMRRGSVECHASMDAHLFQASRLKPFASTGESTKTAGDGQRACKAQAGHLRLIAHPFKGRTARVLERAGLLLPLLAQTLERLQCEARADNDLGTTQHAAESSVNDEWPEWQWPYGDALRYDGEDPSHQVEAQVLVGVWRNWVRLQGGRAWSPPTLRVVKATPLELRSLAQRAPSPGDWLCPVCGFSNDTREPRCRACTGCAFLEQAGRAPSVVTIPGGDAPAFDERDWECSWCRRLEYRWEPACGQCRRPRGSGDSPTSAAIAVCSNPRCCTHEGAPAEQLVLCADPADGALYCQGCWRFWERQGQGQRHRC